MLLAAVAVCITGISAMAYDGHAPLQAMIDREKTQFEFKPVSNLWVKDNNASMEQASKSVTRASFFTLNFDHLGQFMTENNRDITLMIPNPQGGNFEIELTQYIPLSGGFSVEGDDGIKLTKHDYTPGLQYRGVLKGIPGSIAAFSFFNNEVYGLFSIPGVGNFTIVPNTLVTNDVGNNHYIMYNDMDLLIKSQAPGCATDALPTLEIPDHSQLGKNVFNNCKEVKIFVRSDYSCYLKKNSNLSSTTNYVIAIFNVVSTLYRNEGIYVALHKVIVNTTTDAYQSLPYNSSHDFLDKFGELTQNTMQGADLAVLFSARTNTNNQAVLGGVAWLDVLCDDYYYYQGVHFGPYAFVNINNSTINAFPTYGWNTASTTHELGHNLGSHHTHACDVWSNGQAIDGCYTLEDGPCTINGQQYPTGGGTIMSYCHLQSVGVNLSLGFGTQPGNLIRNKVNSASCPVIYAPNIATTSSVLSNANRECTDPSGVTYYWNDGTNADTSGDRIILKIKKGTNNIGNLDQTGFAVQSTAGTGNGSGTGISFNLPAGLPIGTEVGMRRYWKITPLTQPASAVEVFVPFTFTDISDVDGSVPGAPATLANFMFYNVTSAAVDPNPAAGLAGATSTNLKLYYYSTVSGPTNWKSSPVGFTQYAQYPTTSLVGGAGFINYVHPLSITNTEISAISVYPNPINDSWTIDVPSGGDMMLQVYATDGKVVQLQSLHAGANIINSKELPTGVYFYRVTGATATYTGSIIKE